MILEDLGYDSRLEAYRKEQNIDPSGIGRIISVQKERYILKTAEKEFMAEITGNLRYSAGSRSDFPAVGDWVSFIEYEGDMVLINGIFPRKTLIERKAAGGPSEKQLIAANIDMAIIVQAVDRDFNINRLERYLTICNTTGVRPVIALSKIDLAEQAHLENLVSDVRKRIQNVSVIPVSNETRAGYEEIRNLIGSGITACLLGSSGVGKSSLINNLAGRDTMKTGHLSSSTGKGRHVTSHRELIMLESGGMVIDNPGMREVGMTDIEEGMNTTFDKIARLSSRCRYRDCTHRGEAGCAVLEAVERGEIDRTSYENYQKLQREKEHFEMSTAEKRKKDKDFGKMLRRYKDDMKRNER
jgi:ribosome biogenesis GTPase